MTKRELERLLYYNLQLDHFFTNAIERLTSRRARVRLKIEEARKVLTGQRLLFDELSQSPLAGHAQPNTPAPGTGRR